MFFAGLTGLISSLFWALVITITLWIVCAFSGKLVNSSFRMTTLLHLLCFAVAVPTIIFFVVIFTCNKANRMVTKAETTFTNLILSDNQFVDQFHRQINKSSSVSDTGELTKYLTSQFSDRLSAEYPVLDKYFEANQLLQNVDLKKQLACFANNSDGLDVGEIKEIVQATVSSFTKGIRSKIKSTRRNIWISIILLQSISFGIVCNKASNYRNSMNYSSIYEQNEY